MTEKILTGDQAVAYGALEAGVHVVTGYPGSPATKVFENILELSRDNLNRHIEWSVNEKVAFEIALGASLGGDRALVCLKCVGMNITVDPIMTANLTGITGGLVIFLGDDPGAWFSQNEQDTRLLVDLLELPLMEVSSLQEGKDMMAAAFDISEEFQTAVIVRGIRTFSKAEGPVQFADEPAEVERTVPLQKTKGFIRGKNKWVCTTFNVLENHKKLHDKLERVRQRFENSPFNKIVGKNGRQHIIAPGLSYAKLEDAMEQKLDELAALKLGTLFPLPKDLIVNFLETADSVTVLEDGEPYIENKVKAIAHDAHLNVEVRGKTSGDVPREGELTKDDIINALAPDIQRPASSIQAQTTSSEPLETEKTFCDGCPYTPTFRSLSKVIEELGEDPVIISEPGCSVRLNAPPFEMLDVKFSMGSAIGIASGLARTRAKIKPIAVCGDSSFFHTGVNGLINVIQNRANILILVLDNMTTAMSGRQPHPGSGRDARGRSADVVDIAEIAKACGVPSIIVVDPENDREAMEQAFRRGLTADELSMVVIRRPCPLITE